MHRSMQLFVLLTFSWMSLTHLLKLKVRFDKSEIHRLELIFEVVPFLPIVLITLLFVLEYGSYIADKLSRFLGFFK
jgi:hypothetical protein